MGHRRRLCLAVMITFGLIVTGLATASSVPAGAADGVAAPAAEDLVTQQYQDFLARPPDPGGLEYWMRQLDNGVPAPALIQSMAEQPEFEQITAPLVRLYLAYFRRAPDFDGLVFWSGRLRAGQDIASVSENFAGSREFVITYGALDDGAFVDLVYRNVLGRSADAGGRDYWLGQMRRGTDRGDVMTAFSESDENQRATFGTVRATMLYLGMLRRAPDPAGQAYWASLIDARVPYRDIITGFFDSAEYRLRLMALLPDRQPLTGEATRAAATRTVLAVKIDNVPRARPQVGLNQADLVFEEKVEGDLTRLIAMFHSDVPSVIGPVRSIRTTDFDILAAFAHPMLAASGANRTILQLLEGAPVQNVNALVAGGAYYREPTRPSPHNLFARTTDLYASAPNPGSAPDAPFRYRSSGAAITSPTIPTTGVDIEFGRTSVRYRWSPVRRGWVRTQDGIVHTDAGGAAVAPENVVVMIVDYAVSIADAESPEAVTVGTGPIEVFSEGVRISGTWSRSAATDRIVLRDLDGRELLLTPGETWVALAPAGSVVVR